MFKMTFNSVHRYLVFDQNSAKLLAFKINENTQRLRNDCFCLYLKQCFFHVNKNINVLNVNTFFA